MKSRFPGLALMACFALIPALPADAANSTMPASAPDSRDDSAATAVFDADWRTRDDALLRTTESNREVGMWPLALIGPAAMILIVLTLGITITTRSLRDDFRKQRSQNRQWQQGVMLRASQANRA